MKDIYWDIILVVAVVGMCLAIALPLAYLASLGIVKTMHPEYQPYDARNNPDCDPITGELRPEVFAEWQKHQWDNPRMGLIIIDFCNIPANATVSGISMKVSGGTQL